MGRVRHFLRLISLAVGPMRPAGSAGRAWCGGAVGHAKGAGGLAAVRPYRFSKSRNALKLDR
jgi:hypothetical protein